MNIFDSIFLTAFVSSLAEIISFLLSVWGAIFITWAGVKAARRMFIIETQPWKGMETANLENTRLRFAQKILFGLDFFLAGQVIRLLIMPTRINFLLVFIIVLIRSILAVIVTRELRSIVVLESGRTTVKK